MSWKHSKTSEACPCGAGVVVITHSESDNGYSGDMWSIEVNCSECNQLAWRELNRGVITCTRVDPQTGQTEKFTYPRPFGTG